MPEIQRTQDQTLGSYLRGKRNWYLGGGVLLLLQQSMMASRDLLVRDAVNAAVGTSGSSSKLIALTIVVISLVAAAARVSSRIVVFWAGRNVEYEIRKALLDHLQRLGPAFFRTMPTGDIMSRAVNDLTQVRLLLGFGILNIISSSFSVISAVFVMVSVSLSLTLASFATLPLLWLVTRTFSMRMFQRTKENQEAIGKMSDTVLSSLSGARVVRAFGLVPSEIAAFEVQNLEYQERSLALARLRGAMGPVMGSISALGILVVFWYGGTLLSRGEIDAGDFVAFWLALLRLSWPLLALGFVAAIIQRGRAGFDRIKTILQAVPEIQSGELVRTAPVAGDLEVRGLSFSYGKNEVLSNVSFSLGSGQSLAIVGSTGSGKSTLASLLPRLLPTPRGTVFLDGDDICDLDLARVRSAIGYAQQDAFLFSTTVSRNIGYALGEAELSDGSSEARIAQAARGASVYEEILALPEGFDTVVGERGVQLSGGQRQRIALGRALLRDAPILVLDDPLSAVDAKTETAILDAIEREKQRRTVVLVTHRIAAAKRCDRIVVLDKGRVVADGTHDELRQQDGLYAAFAREQELEADLAEASA